MYLYTIVFPGVQNHEVIGCIQGENGYTTGACEFGLNVHKCPTNSTVENCEQMRLPLAGIGILMLITTGQCLIVIIVQRLYTLH